MRTVRRVSAATPGRPLSTLLTVASDTPAWDAMSARRAFMVITVVACDRRPGSSGRKGSGAEATPLGSGHGRPPAFVSTLHYGSSGTYLPVKGNITMATVTYDKASRLYAGATIPAVDDLDLDVQDGEFLVLVGPSGCGKSTSLRMLAGLEDVTSGAIRIGERDVTHLAPKDRDIAMVFQNYALYPHMSVGDNMGFALKIAGVPKDEIVRRVNEAAKLLDLEAYVERKPKALSGGQRQRVAMGRAIVREPQVFLMDEPLSNLDAKLRVQTRTQIAALQRRLGITTLYVTHDQVEAMTMGDRVAVLKDGILQQCDTPSHDVRPARPTSSSPASSARRR